MLLPLVLRPSAHADSIRFVRGGGAFARERFSQYLDLELGFGGKIPTRRKSSEEGEASRPSPTASFRSVPRRSPSSKFANLVARTTIVAILFRRIHTPDTVDTLTRAISPPLTKLPVESRQFFSNCMSAFNLEGEGIRYSLSRVRVMAHPEGLEPPTLWFEARCSIQLS